MQLAPLELPKPGTCWSRVRLRAGRGWRRSRVSGHRPGRSSARHPSLRARASHTLELSMRLVARIGGVAEGEGRLFRISGRARHCSAISSRERPKCYKTRLRSVEQLRASSFWFCSRSHTTRVGRADARTCAFKSRLSQRQDAGDRDSRATRAGSNAGSISPPMACVRG